MFHTFIAPHVLVVRLLATVTSTLFFCGAFVIQGTAQSWHPAAQIDGARLNINIVTLPDGTTLIPLRRVVPKQKDTMLFYSIQSLLTDRQPWHQQMPGLPNLHGFFDGNSNGYPEAIFSRTGLPSLFAVDVFTESMTTEELPRKGGLSPFPEQMVDHRGLLDGDRYLDQLVARRNEEFAWVVYGDSVRPLLDYSVVPANYQRSSERRAKILAVGKLSGRTCMLQLAFKADTYDSGYYQLLELNQDDVRARRDTIRTTLLNEVVNPSKKLFGDVVLKADTVWHFFPGGLDINKLSLKVTVSKSSISLTRSVIGESDYDFWYGQGKERIEWNYPVAMSAHRLIAAESAVSPGLGQRVLRLFVCSNTDSAELSVYADAQLPVHADSNRFAAVHSMVLIPDHDGDGVEDVIVEHGWTDPGSVEYRNAVSIFLTTQIKPVSVDGDAVTVPDLDTTAALYSHRAGDVWVVPNASQCYRQDVSPVYNVNGERIASLNVHVNGLDIIIHDDGAIGAAPAWCVIGECVVRIN
jgi:hypothetical protein